MWIDITLQMIHFKSEPMNYWKERDGTKTNTVKHIDAEEEEMFRPDYLDGNIKYICIHNTHNYDEFFIREITNTTYTTIEGIDLWIFSW